MTSALPEIGDVKRLTLHPGDRLIIRLRSDRVTAEEVAAIKNSTRRVLGLGPEFPVLVCGPGVDFEVVGEAG